MCGGHLHRTLEVISSVPVLLSIPEVWDTLADDPLVVEPFRQVLAEVVAASSRHRSDQLQCSRHR